MKYLLFRNVQDQNLYIHYTVSDKYRLSLVECFPVKFFTPTSCLSRVFAVVMRCQGGLSRNIISHAENLTKGKEWPFVLKFQKYFVTTVVIDLSISFR